MKINGDTYEVTAQALTDARTNWVANYNFEATEDPESADWDAVYRAMANELADNVEFDELGLSGFDNDAERATFIEAFVAEKHRMRDGQE